MKGRAHKMVVFQWQDGKKVLVWPEKLALGQPRFPTPAVESTPVRGSKGPAPSGALSCVGALTCGRECGLGSTS